MAYTTTVVKYAPVKYPLWGYLTLAFDGNTKSIEFLGPFIKRAWSPCTFYKNTKILGSFIKRPAWQKTKSC